MTTDPIRTWLELSDIDRRIDQIEMTFWLESLGWEVVETRTGIVTGYRYGERTYIDLATAENWWRIRETCPFGPPRF